MAKVIQRFLLVAAALAWLLLSPASHAGVEQLSEREFRALAADLANKVNLFRDAWEMDPKAEFYGGTTRDYLYWLKGKFKEAKTKGQAAKIEKELRSLEVIDVREFIIGESDVDIVTKNKLGLQGPDYGVRKIDAASADIFDAATEAGQNEILQGHIPAEKIRLRQSGFVKPGKFGDGIKEIYQGKLSIHFTAPEDFAKSKYAREGINHPILLGLRYLRLQAMNYFHSHGAGAPERAALLEGMSESSRRSVEAVLEKARKPGELSKYFENSKFRSWLNGSIQKAYRSYTNPTAANELMKKFGVPELQQIYGDKIEPTNQYLFARPPWDEQKIGANLQKLGLNRSEIYTSVDELFPGRVLYHGTGSQEAFRSILFQGVIESKDGSAGKGLYGVSEKSREFSEEWKRDKNLLVKFPVAENARVVDLTGEAGAKILALYPGDVHRKNWNQIAEDLGADILRYPYGKTDAYVVKNSAVLGRAEGVYQKILPLSELSKLAQQMNDPKELAELVRLNRLKPKEALLIVSLSPFKDHPILSKLIGQPSFKVAEWLENEIKNNSPNLRDPALVPFIQEHRAFGRPGIFNQFVSQVMAKPDWKTNPDLLRYFMESDLLKDPDEAYQGGPAQKILTEYFSQPHSTQDRELLLQLVGQPNARQASIALSQPHWMRDEELLKKYAQAHQTRQIGSVVAGLNLPPEEFRDQIRWQRDRFSSQEIDKGLYHVLQHAKDDTFADLLREVLENGHITSYAEYIFDSPVWANHPDLVHLYLDQGGHGSPILKILEYPAWKARPEYRELVAKAWRHSGRKRLSLKESCGALYNWIKGGK